MKTLHAFALLSTFGLTRAALDAAAITTKYFGNDAPWFLDRIPLFESSDTTLNDVYYYRWKIFRSHQRDLGVNGYISTEFLNDVGWQTNPWASLNDATGFHLLEGRWCRDRRFKEDYATFIFSNYSNTRQFSESMTAAVWQGYLIDGVAEDAVSRLDEMMAVFNAWVDAYDSSKQLFYVEPLRDATEYTISSIDASGGQDGFTGGLSFRPSINSFQYANALAISNLAALKGGIDDIATSFAAKAELLKNRTEAALWNATFEHFIDRFQVNNAYVRYWDPIRGRELVGYVPWTHDLPSDTIEYANAWSHILNSSQLAGEHGLRTNEPSYQYYMRQYRYEGTNPECQWNGPVWPFQTTQVLTGLANFLDHYPVGTASGVITSSDYVALLRQYANLHYNPDRGGILDLEEDYYPDSGAPIVGLKRSPHYFHSGFVDLILSGFVGIRARANDVLEVNPLVDSSINYFRAEKIIYHGHEVAVQWDAAGSQYGTTGLVVEVDDKVVATSPTLERLTVDISRISPPKIERPIAKSVQLQATTAYPVGSVSVPNADVNAVHSAIDGRIFFYPETDVANGFEFPVANSTAEVWFAIDFGTRTTISNAEIAFFTDEEQGFEVPGSYRVQIADSSNSAWADVEEGKYTDPVANGITAVSWGSVSTGKIRLVLTSPLGKQIRLVEFKVY